MLLRQPIMQGGRQEQRLVHIRRPKALSHARILSPNTLWKSCYVWYFGRIYSRQTPSRTKRATNRELIVVATMILRMIGTPVFSDRTEFSVTAGCQNGVPGPRGPIMSTRSSDYARGRFFIPHLLGHEIDLVRRNLKLLFDVRPIVET